MPPKNFLINILGKELNQEFDKIKKSWEAHINQDIKEHEAILIAIKDLTKAIKDIENKIK